MSADGGGSPEKQLADIDGLIARAAKALIILAMDKDATLRALAKAHAHANVNANANAKNIPVIGYDRLIESPSIFYSISDNKDVGRMQARAAFTAKRKGNCLLIE